MIETLFFLLRVKLHPFLQLVSRDLSRYQVIYDRGSIFFHLKHLLDIFNVVSREFFIFPTRVMQLNKHLLAYSSSTIKELLRPLVSDLSCFKSANALSSSSPLSLRIFSDSLDLSYYCKRSLSSSRLRSANTALASVRLSIYVAVSS